MWVALNAEILDEDEYPPLSVGATFRDVVLVFVADESQPSTSAPMIAPVEEFPRDPTGLPRYVVCADVHLLGPYESTDKQFHSFVHGVASLDGLAFEVIMPRVGSLSDGSRVMLRGNFVVVRSFEGPTKRTRAAATDYTVSDLIVIDRLVDGSPSEWWVALTPAPNSPIP